MEQEITGKMIIKLPKWAQAHIKKIERERDVAIRALNDVLDSQEPSPIFYDDLVSTGENTGPTSKRFYVQSHKITVEHNGVSLSIYAGRNIDLRWESAGGKFNNFVAFVPNSHQAASLVAKENM